MAGIFLLAWDEDRPDPRDYYDEPDPCPVCGDTREVEDEEGFYTDCPCTTSPYDDSDTTDYVVQWDSPRLTRPYPAGYCACPNGHEYKWEGDNPACPVCGAEDA